MKTKGMTKKPLSKLQKILLGIVFALGLCVLLLLAYYYNPYQWLAIDAYNEPISDELLEKLVVNFPSYGITEWKLSENQRALLIRQKDFPKIIPSQKNYHYYRNLELNRPRSLGFSKKIHTGYRFTLRTAAKFVEKVQIDAIALNKKGQNKASPPLSVDDTWNFSKEEGARYRFEVRVIQGTASETEFKSIFVWKLPFEEMKS